MATNKRKIQIITSFDETNLCHWRYYMPLILYSRLLRSLLRH